MPRRTRTDLEKWKGKAQRPKGVKVKDEKTLRLIFLWQEGKDAPE